jgi:hypothetical protein
VITGSYGSFKGKTTSLGINPQQGSGFSLHLYLAQGQHHRNSDRCGTEVFSAYPRHAWLFFVRDSQSNLEIQARWCSSGSNRKLVSGPRLARLGCLPGEDLA